MPNMSTLSAITKRDAIYPGFVNVSQDMDGNIVLTVRGDPAKREGSFVCAHAHEKGQHGRCTPGDDNCNNYCNMAPQKGKMQDHPKTCEQVQCGNVASVKLSADEWLTVNGAKDAATTGYKAGVAAAAGALPVLMENEWNEIVSDTGCYPLDIKKDGNKLWFSANHWAAQISNVILKLST